MCLFMNDESRYPGCAQGVLTEFFEPKFVTPQHLLPFNGDAVLLAAGLPHAVNTTETQWVSHGGGVRDTKGRESPPLALLLVATT